MIITDYALNNGKYERGTTKAVPHALQILRYSLHSPPSPPGDRFKFDDWIRIDEPLSLLIPSIRVTFFAHFSPILSHRETSNNVDQDYLSIDNVTAHYFQITVSDAWYLHDTNETLRRQKKTNKTGSTSVLYQNTKYETFYNAKR